MPLLTTSSLYTRCEADILLLGHFCLTAQRFRDDGEAIRRYIIRCTVDFVTLAGDIDACFARRHYGGGHDISMGASAYALSELTIELPRNTPMPL
jgi:hypothetical protein